MDYTASHKILGNILKPGIADLTLPDLNLIIRQFDFISRPPVIESETEQLTTPESSPLRLDDEHIQENLMFSYPVIFPGNKQKYERAIILLHGLNERSWTKYLPWAHRLAEELQRPVILFPISFHINRSPASWSNPRLMSAMLPGTRMRNRRNHSASFVNLALSIRLSDKPLRFFTSGRQSLDDLQQLVTGIQAGTHPYFSKGTGIDFFAYSIGAFLSQITMLTYGDSLLSDARLFMFCGGAPFNRMNGVSKLIMDEEAFQRLRFFYLRQFEREIRSKGPLAELTGKQLSGQAFRAMLDGKLFSNWRKDRFQSMEDRIRAVGLKKDGVIPPSGMAEMLSSRQSETIDFPFQYSHENPFPILGNPGEVDESFDLVFNRAVSFLR